MATFTESRYPQYADQIRRLAEEHRSFQDEPLHLALTFDPGKDDGDIYLLEIISNFGEDEPDPKKELFEIAFSSSESLQLGANHKLHLLLTNPNEFRLACRENWDWIRALRRAIERDAYETLYADDTGKQLMEAVEATEAVLH